MKAALNTWYPLCRAYRFRPSLTATEVYSTSSKQDFLAKRCGTIPQPRSAERQDHYKMDDATPLSSNRAMHSRISSYSFLIGDCTCIRESITLHIAFKNHATHLDIFPTTNPLVRTWKWYFGRGCDRETDFPFRLQKCCRCQNRSSFSHHNCVGLWFSHSAPGRVLLPPPPPPPPPLLLCHIQHHHTHTEHCHIQLCHTHAQLCHTTTAAAATTTTTTMPHTILSHTNAALSHSTLPDTTLSHTHTHMRAQLCHIQPLSHTQHCHTHTHAISSHTHTQSNLTHTHIFATQLTHIQLVTRTHLLRTIVLPLLTVEIQIAKTVQTRKKGKQIV